MNDAQKTNWLIVVLAVMSGIVAATFLGKAPPALPTLRAELGLDLVSAGWVVSVISGTAMLIGMLTGLIADIVGHRRLLLIGLGVLAIGGVMGGTSETGLILLLSRFIEGLGYLFVIVSAPSLIITASIPAQRHLTLGFWGVFMPMGMALAMFISPLILEPLGWRGLWLVLAALSFGLIGIIWLAHPPARQKLDESRPRVWQSIALVLGRPGPMLLALGFGLYAANWTSIMMWLPSFLVEERGLTLTTSAMLAAVIVAVNVPGNMMGGMVLHMGLKRWHAIAIVHVVVGLSAIGIFSVGLPDWVRYGLCLVFSFAGGFLPAASFASVPVHAPSGQQLSMTSGLLMQGSNTGNFFGPVAIAAIVVASGDWNSVVWMIAGTSTLGLLLAFWLGHVERDSSH